MNEIDWKNVLSPKTDRLAQHLCAFSNQEGGGFLVYGMNNDATLFSVTRGDTDAVIKKLGNIALNNLFRSVQIQHDTIDYEGNALLFIYIPEQMEKPVYLRGKTLYDSYQGSARQSVKMSPQEVKQMIAELQGLLFHEQIALTKATADDVLKLLDYNSYFQLTNRNFPKAKRQFLKFWQMPNLL